MQILAALLCIASATASPLLPRQEGSSAATYAGATSSDVYPPPGATPNTELFPSEPGERFVAGNCAELIRSIVVGYAGPTPSKCFLHLASGC